MTSSEDSPLIYVLTRTSARPYFFHMNYQSVQSQTYDRIIHFVSYDDDQTEEYCRQYEELNDYDHNNSMTRKVFKTFRMERIKKQGNGHFPYNLYLNEMMDRIPSQLPGWIIILDDDDIFSHENAVSELVRTIQREVRNAYDKKFLMWQVEFPNDRLVPKRKSKMPPRVGDVSMIGFSFHSSLRRQFLFSDRKGGDYLMIKSLWKELNVVWVDDVLTRINYDRTRRFGSGMRNDLKLSTVQIKEYKLFMENKLSMRKSISLKKKEDDEQGNINSLVIDDDSLNDDDDSSYKDNYSKTVSPVKMNLKIKKNKNEQQEELQKEEFSLIKFKKDNNKDNSTPNLTLKKKTTIDKIQDQEDDEESKHVTFKEDTTVFNYYVDNEQSNNNSSNPSSSTTLSDNTTKNSNSTTNMEDEMDNNYENSIPDEMIIHPQLEKLLDYLSDDTKVQILQLNDLKTMIRTCMLETLNELGLNPLTQQQQQEQHYQHQPRVKNSTTQSKKQQHQEESKPRNSLRSQLNDLLSEGEDMENEAQLNSLLINYAEEDEDDDPTNLEDIDSFLDKIIILNFGGKAGQLQEQLESLGFTNVHIVDANKRKTFWDNLFDLMSSSQKKGLKRFAVLQDNIHLHKNFSSEFAMQFENIKTKKDWKMIALAASQNLTIKAGVDWKYYLDLYPDLRKNKIKDEASAQKHWKLNGSRERRYGQRGVLHPDTLSGCCGVIVSSRMYHDLPKLKKSRNARDFILKNYKQKVYATSPLLALSPINRAVRMRNRFNMEFYEN